MVQCDEVDCKKQAYYGYTYKSPLKCSEHRDKSDTDMVNVHTPRCEICVTKQPVFGHLNGKRLRCGDCRDDTMINLVNKKCEKCNDKQANFGLIKNKPTHCSVCKSKEMYDVVHKLCEKCNIKSALFSVNGGKAQYCGDCRDNNMINVISVKCNKCNIKRATFGLIKNKFTHCADCKDDVMKDVRSRLCEKCNIKIPNFGLIKGKPTHCGDCRDSNMTNVKSIQCKNEYCNTIINNKTYKGYCAYCYGNLFPDCPIVKNYKTKERKVTDFIRDSFPEHKCVFDKIIKDGCSQRRPDIFLDLNTHIIIIEIDENQHRGYDCSCDNKRLMELSRDVDHKSIVLIRFNPDKYIDKNNKKIPSCFSVTKETGALKISTPQLWNERLDNLKTYIDYWINNKTDKIVETIQLYYDQNF